MNSRPISGTNGLANQQSWDSMAQQQIDFQNSIANRKTIRGKAWRKHYFRSEIRYRHRKGQLLPSVPGGHKWAHYCRPEELQAWRDHLWKGSLEVEVPLRCDDLGIWRDVFTRFPPQPVQVRNLASLDAQSLLAELKRSSLRESSGSHSDQSTIQASAWTNTSVTAQIVATSAPSEHTYGPSRGLTKECIQMGRPSGTSTRASVSSEASTTTGGSGFWVDGRFGGMLEGMRPALEDPRPTRKLANKLWGVPEGWTRAAATRRGEELVVKVDLWFWEEASRLKFCQGEENGPMVGQALNNGLMESQGEEESWSEDQSWTDDVRGTRAWVATDGHSDLSDEWGDTEFAELAEGGERAIAERMAGVSRVFWSMMDKRVRDGGFEDAEARADRLRECQPFHPDQGQVLNAGRSARGGCIKVARSRVAEDFYGTSADLGSADGSDSVDERGVGAVFGAGESDEDWLEDDGVSMEWLPTHVYVKEVRRLERVREATSRLQERFTSKCLKRRRLPSLGGKRRQEPSGVVRESVVFGLRECVVCVVREVCVMSSVVPLVVTGLQGFVSFVRLLFWKVLPSHLGSSAALIERGLRLGWG